MDTIRLKSLYGIEIHMHIRTKQYNRLSRANKEDRMHIVNEELHHAKYDLSDMFTRAQWNRAKERLQEGDYYNEVEI